jgi:hypothetical protein
MYRAKFDDPINFVKKIKKGSRAEKKKLHKLYLLQRRKCIAARYWMINTGDT